MTRVSNWKYLISPSLKSLAGYLIACVLLYQFVGYNEPFSASVFAFSYSFVYMSLFYLAPISVLYFTHKSSSKGKLLTLNGNKLAIKTGDMTLVWPDDFTEVEMYQTNAAYNNRFDWSLWGHYGYYLLRNEHGQQIALSFLLTEGLDLKVWKSNLTRKRKYFPIPPKDKLT